MYAETNIHSEIKTKIKDSYIHKMPQPQEIRRVATKNVSVVIILRFFNMQKSGIFVVIFRLGYVHKTQHCVINIIVICPSLILYATYQCFSPKICSKSIFLFISDILFNLL